METIDGCWELVEQIKADAQRAELEADTYGKAGQFDKARERQIAARIHEAHARQLEARLRGSEHV